MAMSKQGAPLNSGCLTAESNPLLNNVVLQTLFEHAAVADLKNWRKVCKLWWELSLPRWRREVWVKVTDNGEEEDGRLFLDNYMNLMENEDEGAFEGDLYQFRKYPFRRFKFTGWELRSETLEGDLTRQADFWKTFGTQITYLEIKDSTFPTFQSFSSIICEFLPNLKTVRLLGNRYLFYEESWKAITAVRAGLKRSPVAMKGLTKLEIDLGDGFDANCHLAPYGLFLLEHMVSNSNIKSLKLANIDWELEPLLEAMMPTNKKDSKLAKLDLLQIQSMSLPSFEFQHSNMLSQLRFPLTELFLDIGIETTAASFKPILESYAVTLRKLVVYRESGSGFMNENYIVQYFPFDVQLPSLSELWLVGAAVSQNLNFLRFVPNLKRLLLICNIGKSLLSAGSYLCDQKMLENLLNGRKWTESDFYSQNSVIADTDFRQQENLVCSQLEDFIVSGRNQGICNPKHVAALARLMPNLKRVMLGLGNDGFRVVCNRWKKLESLVVQPYAVDEFGITGILPDVNGHPRLPNITDLKSLRYFGMGYETKADDKVGLSDDSCLNGIAELPNLRALTVVCSDEMSGEVRAQLKSKFPNGKILRRTEGDSVSEWHLDEQALPTWSNDVSSDVVSENESNGGASEDDVNENEDRESAADSN